MKRNIICILIALMVLSLSALLLASDVVLIRTVAEVGSDLNGVPIHIKIYERARDTHVIKTMSHQELRDNWADHDGKFVRFTGKVEHVETYLQTKQVWKLELAGDIPAGDTPITVYPLDLVNPPETYERGQKYEFTGLLMRYTGTIPALKRFLPMMRVYAFQIRKPIEEQEDAAD